MVQVAFVDPSSGFACVRVCISAGLMRLAVWAHLQKPA